MLQRQIPYRHARDELVVQIKGEEWDRQRPEVVLENRGDTADIVEAVLVVKIEGRVVAALEQLGDHLGLTRTTCLAVDTFILKSYGESDSVHDNGSGGGGQLTNSIDSVDALLDDHRNHTILVPRIRTYLLNQVASKHGWCCNQSTQGDTSSIKLTRS